MDFLKAEITIANCFITLWPLNVGTLHGRKISLEIYPKIHMNVKMSDFEAKIENNLAVFISKHNKIYVS